MAPPRFGNAPPGKLPPALRANPPALSSRDIIPNIDIARIIEPHLPDARVLYGAISRFAPVLGWRTSAHRHDRFFQVHFIEGGSLDLMLDGVSYTARAPVVFFTPPAVPHAFQLDEHAPGHVLTVDRSLIRTLADQDKALQQMDVTRPRCLPLGGPGYRTAQQLARLFRMLRTETENGGPGASAASEALAALILITVLRLDGPDRQEALPRRHEYILFRRFMDLLEQHFAERWPLGRYAAALAVEESRLTGLCRRIAGKPPKQLVLDRQMLEARRMLTFSGHSVVTVAAALGFDDPSYFSRLFRFRHGMTPSQYRAGAEAIMPDSRAAEKVLAFP